MLYFMLAAMKSASPMSVSTAVSGLLNVTAEPCSRAYHSVAECSGP